MTRWELLGPAERRSRGMANLALLSADANSGLDTAQLRAELGSLGYAYHVSLPELTAIARERLQVVNFDIPTAFTKALGAESYLSGFREQVAALPGFDITQFDRLTQYAMAMMHAHLQYRAALKRPEHVDAQLISANKWGKILQAEIRSLLARDCLPAHVLRVLKQRRGHLGTASNLLTMVALLRRHWASIAGKTALSGAELLQAEQIGEQLVFALSSRKQPLRDLKQLAEARQRAFTLFSRAYSQVRRALQYWCWETDQAERLLPTLYPRHARRGRSKVAGITTEPTSDVEKLPAEPVPSKTQENETRSAIVASDGPFV